MAVIALAVLVGMAPTGSAAAVVAPSVCTGALGAGSYGDLEVPAGATCTLNGAQVNGSIKVGSGAALLASASAIGGNIDAEEAAAVTLNNQSSVGGNIQVKKGGGVTVEGVKVGGNIQLEANRNALRISFSKVGGNIEIDKNQGGVTVSDNHIGGNLQCKDNKPAPTGGRNQAASFKDQCADFAGIPGEPPAAGEPITIAVESQTVLLQGAAPTVSVPVRIDAKNNQKVSSAAFSLDYDAACLQYSSTSLEKIAGDFERSVTHELADTAGELDIAFWDQDSPVAELAAPVVVATVTFNVLPACQKDGVTPVNLATSPAPSLGNAGGNPVPNQPRNGTVTIDWNRTATAITLTPNTIAENQPAATAVGTLASNDPDADDTFVFSLVSGAGDTDNSLFTVDGTTVRASQAFNFEVKNTYTIRVQVADNKGPLLAQALTIAVNDVNEAPTAITLDTTDVVEDQPAGSTVATVTVTDPEPYDTFTMALVGPDASYFVVDGLTVKVGAAGLPAAEIKDSYTFTIVITDSAGNSYTQEVTFHVVNHVELSVPASSAFPPLWVPETGQVVVPVNYLAKNNKVQVVEFVLDYEEGCLAYAGNEGAADVQDDGKQLSILVKGAEPFNDGKLVTLSFKATALCASPDALSPLKFGDAKASESLAPVYTFDGEVYVIPNDRRGDCNSDGAVDAADFMAEVQEIFDDADSNGVDKGYWLMTPRFTYNGSPIGCDANSSTEVEVADILCTVNVVFGDSACTVATRQAAAVAAPALLKVQTQSGDSDRLLVVIDLAANGNQAAGAAFSLVYDPNQLALDPTDANQDGLPDAISVNAPADTLTIAHVGFAGDQIDFALVDQQAPLAALPDGNLVTVSFKRLDTGAPRVILMNVSLGSTNAVQVPVAVDYSSNLSSAFQVMLPMVTR